MFFFLFCFVRGEEGEKRLDFLLLSVILHIALRQSLFLRLSRRRRCTRATARIGTVAGRALTLRFRRARRGRLFAGRILVSLQSDFVNHEAECPEPSLFDLNSLRLELQHSAFCDQGHLEGVYFVVSNVNNARNWQGAFFLSPKLNPPTEERPGSRYRRVSALAFAQVENPYHSATF